MQKKSSVIKNVHFFKKKSAIVDLLYCFTDRVDNVRRGELEEEAEHAGDGTALRSGNKRGGGIT